MNIYDSVDWCVEVIVGNEVFRGDSGGIYSYIGIEYGRGDGKVF